MAMETSICLKVSIAIPEFLPLTPAFENAASWHPVALGIWARCPVRPTAGLVALLELGNDPWTHRETGRVEWSGRIFRIIPWNPGWLLSGDSPFLDYMIMTQSPIYINILGSGAILEPIINQQGKTEHCSICLYPPGPPALKQNPLESWVFKKLFARKKYPTGTLHVSKDFNWRQLKSFSCQWTCDICSIL